MIKQEQATFIRLKFLLFILDTNARCLRLETFDQAEVKMSELLHLCTKEDTIYTITSSISSVDYTAQTFFCSKFEVWTIFYFLRHLNNLALGMYVQTAILCIYFINAIS